MDVLATNQAALSDTIREDRQGVRLSVELSERPGHSLPSVEGQVEVEGEVGKPRDAIIIHLHGGGWVAQSPESHLDYLHQWAAQLDTPILSIDYSLAPEAPYPRACQEVFYTYVWMLANLETLGTTGHTQTPLFFLCF